MINDKHSDRERLETIEVLIKELKAEEILVYRIAQEVEDRVERKINAKNLLTIIILILGSVGSINIAIPQLKQDLRKDLQVDVGDRLEKQVDLRVEQAEKRTVEKVQEQVDQIEQQVQEVKQLKNN